MVYPSFVASHSCARKEGQGWGTEHWVQLLWSRFSASLRRFSGTWALEEARGRDCTATPAGALKWPGCRARGPVLPSSSSMRMVSGRRAERTERRRPRVTSQKPDAITAGVLTSCDIKYRERGNKGVGTKRLRDQELAWLAVKQMFAEAPRIDSEVEGADGYAA